MFPFKTKLISLPRLIKIELSILSLVTLGIIFSFFIVWQTQYKKNSLTQKQKQLSETINIESIALRDFAAYKSKVEKLTMSYRRYEQINRQPYQPKSLINAVVVLAQKYEIALNILQPLSPKQKGDFYAYPWRMTIAGEYSSLINFLNTVLSPSFAYFATIGKIDLKPHSENSNPGKTKKLVLEMSLFIYKNGDKSLNLSITNPSQQTDIFVRDPFSLTTENNAAHKLNNSKPRGLNFWPLEKLKLLGTLRLDNKIFAMIQDQNGDSYRVDLGDKIGLEQKTIIAITDNDVIAGWTGSDKKELQRIDMNGGL